MSTTAGRQALAAKAKILAECYANAYATYAALRTSPYGFAMARNRSNATAAELNEAIDELASSEDLGLMSSLQDILDGRDTGAGVCPEPWESLRRRVIELVGWRAMLAQCRLENEEVPVIYRPGGRIPLLTDPDIAPGVDAMQAEMMSSPEKARAFLIEGGFLNADGTALHARYGGPEEQEPPTTPQGSAT